LDFEYKVIRSSRKTVALEITHELSVLVRAPRRMTDAAVKDFVCRHSRWVDVHMERARQRKLRHPEPSEEQREELIGLAKKVLPEKASHYAELMGVSPKSIKITSAKTRFGSCSGKNAICFSWRLMAYPEEAVDYVVIHELAHIKHKNHSPAFYAEIKKYMPDYRERQKMLR